MITRLVNVLETLRNAASPGSGDAEAVATMF
jgi:hypothetical protein